MSEAQDTYDLVIIGSGAGSITAALAAVEAGRSVVIVEKTDKIGGSGALSGGVAWIPDNPVAKRIGLEDSPEKALAYLNACAGPPGPGSSPERRAAYVREGARAIVFLEGLGMKFKVSRGYSDYHEGELPGGLPEGRSIIAEPYDLRRLGAYADKLRRWPKGVETPVAVAEVSKLAITGRTLASQLTYVIVGLRLLRRKLGAQLVAMGGALQGRLLEIALNKNIPILTDTRFDHFLVEDGRVTGVSVTGPDGPMVIHARQGVLLNAGGFARNAEMRAKYQTAPTSTNWTLANPGDTGEVLEAAMELGADTHLMDLSVWTTASPLPSGAPTLSGGVMNKPHAILVDQTGQRYANEATSYVTIGITMFERHKRSPTVPSWIVMDSDHRKSYFLAAKAGPPSKAWLESGAILKADTLRELAEKCGMPPAGLEATVARFNGFARAGKDDDFGRGHSKFAHFWGDASVRPNPSLGPIARAPFYAIRAYPGDVGTFGGLVTDEFARVRRKDGSVIEGLYAAGNITAPVTGPSYPGAGASIGPALVFGYVAAHHALGLNQ